MQRMILATKLYIPPLRPQAVMRPRLTQRLLTGLSRKLTLISAPAGFGKTTLAIDFVAQSGRPAVWISLDENDNDPIQFLTCFLAAFRQIKSTFGETVQAMLQSPPTLPPEKMMLALINDLADLSSQTLLVLDDYHFITAGSIHQALTTLLDYLPPTAHLVIVSRAMPPLPLSRLRAHDQMIELRAADLRFTLDEAKTFLTQTIALDLRPEQIATLEARTEGWVTGLQLAGLSLQQRSDPEALTLTFGGSHHYVLDYLIDEVISHQPESIRQFLLQTSILDRLCGSLADTVIGNPPVVDTGLDTPLEHQTSAETILHHLDRANLFLMPLDGERRWYRYHHLFAEALQTRLKQSYPPAHLAELHKRAAQWHAAHDNPAAAIDHAFAAGRFDLAGDLILRIADEMWTQGTLSILTNWLERLPDPLLAARPELKMYCAWTRFFAAQESQDGRKLYLEAEAMLQAAETSLAQQPPPAAVWEKLYGMRTAVASVLSDIERTIQYGQQALAQQPEAVTLWRSAATISLGFAYRRSGQLKEAIRTFEEACRLSQASGNLSGALFAFDSLAELLIEQGRLFEAERIYQQAIAYLGDHKASALAIFGQIYIGFGRLLLEFNRLHEAVATINAGIQRYQQGGFPIAEAQLLLVRLHLLQGDSQAALTLLEEIEQAARSPAYAGESLVRLRRQQARLALRRGDLLTAEQWRQSSGLHLSDPPDPRQAETDLTLARLAIAVDRPAEIFDRLATWRQQAEASGRQGHLIELGMLEALAYAATRVEVEAFRALQETLTLAAPAGYLRLFLDEGPSMLHLLHRLLTSPGQINALSPAVRDYAEKLLLTLRVEQHQPGDEPAIQPLVEPLSERELEILQLIVAGRSNQEIAATLVVATSTIKWHINHIYGKLGVRTRPQAMAKAHELGLVD